MISSILKQFKKKDKIQLNRSEQDNKPQRIYDLLNAETKTKFLCLPYTKQRRTIFFYRKRDFKDKGEWMIEPKMKRRLFYCSCYGD